MNLSSDDLERVRVADVPDFGYELALGGARLADGISGPRLAEWRLDVARGWNRNHNMLFDLYTRKYVPAFFGQVASAKPSGIDPESPAATAHAAGPGRSGALTPFTRALGDGHPGAVSALNGILAAFRAKALDPIADESPRSSPPISHSEHPCRDRRHRRHAQLPASLDPLGRPKTAPEDRLRRRGVPRRKAPDPPAHGVGHPAMFDPRPGSVTVIYPATAGPVTRDPDLDTPPRPWSRCSGRQGQPHWSPWSGHLP